MSKNKLIGPKSPFDDISLSHLVLDAVAELGADIKDQRKFINRLRHIEYGLSAEDECAAILAWLGNCLMVHKLFQEGYSSPELGNIQIPDLLAVFSNGEERFCAAIEVKCNDELFLPWKKEYREKLSRYGDLLGVPLLLAWRPRKLGEWLLLDAMSEELACDDKINIEDALVNNFMGIVAGDFWIVPQPDIGLNFEGQIMGNKTPTKNGYKATIKINRAFIGSRGGQKFEDLNESCIALILSTAVEEYCEEKDGKMSWGHITPGSTSSREVNSISAQKLLRTLIGWAQKDNERIEWRYLLKNLNNVISNRRMEEQLSENIGGVVRYIMHVQPKALPSFLTKTWCSKYKISKSGK